MPPRRNTKNPAATIVGIGVQLYQVESNISAMYSGDEKYSNANQQLTGLILFKGILKGGPADLAGIRDMDVILSVDGIEVDGKDDHAMSLWGINYRILNGPEGKSIPKEGEPIRFKVRRIDKSGNTLAEFETDVRRAKIDKVAWLPMDTWLTSRTANCGTTGECDFDVSFASKVQETTGGRFHYSYNIKNSGRKAVMVNWEALKRVRCCSNLVIEPGQSKELALRLDEFPVESGLDAKFRVWEKNSPTSWLARLFRISELKITTFAFVPASEAK